MLSVYPLDTRVSGWHSYPFGLFQNCETSEISVFMYRQAGVSVEELDSAGMMGAHHPSRSVTTAVLSSLPAASSCLGSDRGADVDSSVDGNSFSPGAVLTQKFWGKGIAL